MKFSVLSAGGGLVTLEGENGSMLVVMESKFDFPLHEGMILDKTRDGFVPCPEAESEKRSEMDALLQQIKENSTQNN